ncbi:glutathione S-transferase [Poronia punctata]|nr:glutathione S-transferase [Poronia punctata]
MATDLKPIQVFGQGGPNPPKVVMILEELGLPYEIKEVKWAEIKKEPYLSINPNGRIPAIHDPNSDLTLWESGAIIEYLVEKYDTENKISYPKGSNESFLTKQWLYYQVTGQGPYFGQAVWFVTFHPEKLPSAINRYLNEIKRVTGVVEGHLARQKAKATEGSEGPWLVGDKITFADIAWLMWQRTVEKYFPKDQLPNYDEDFPLVKEWLARINARSSVQKALEHAKHQG